MKKFVAVISILLLLFCHFSAIGEEINLEMMSDIEINELLSKVLEEIGKRDNFASDMWWPGSYVCGEDFEPGTYLIEPVGIADKGEESAFIYLWESKTVKDNNIIDTLVYDEVSIGSTRKYTFSEGNILKITHCVCSLIRV